jgi:hypothetical protein
MADQKNKKIKSLALAVAVSGKLRSGKDTLADYLIANHGFKKYSFADSFKQLLQTCKSPEEAMQKLAKYYRTLYHKADMSNADLLRKCAQVIDRAVAVNPKGWQTFPKEELYDKKTDLSRLVMQNFGNTARELLSPTFWVDITLYQAGKEMAAGKSVVIADVRYKNELQESVRRLQAIPTRVERPKQLREQSGNAEHPSEVDLDDVPSEKVIAPDATVMTNVSEDLFNKFDKKHPEFKGLKFQYLIDNSGSSLEKYYRQVNTFVKSIGLENTKEQEQEHAL